MKLSTLALASLKKFSEINKSIVINEGDNHIATKNVEGNVYGRVVTEETFPVDIAIYDLPRFLSTVSRLEDPEFDFQSDRVVVSSGKRRVTFFYAEKSLLVYPKGVPNLTDALATFTLNGKDIDEIVKMSSVLGIPDIRLVASDGTLTLSAMDKANDTNDTYSTEIGDIADDITFSLDMRRDVLSPIFNEYEYKATVHKVGKNLIVRFATETDHINFIVATSPSSTFGE